MVIQDQKNPALDIDIEDALVSHTDDTDARIWVFRLM